MDAGTALMVPRSSWAVADSTDAHAFEGCINACKVCGRQHAKRTCAFDGLWLGSLLGGGLPRLCGSWLCWLAGSAAHGRRSWTAWSACWESPATPPRQSAVMGFVRLDSHRAELMFNGGGWTPLRCPTLRNCLSEYTPSAVGPHSRKGPTWAFYLHRVLLLRLLWSTSTG